ncbi:MAG: CHRD domain-containing protein [Chloroflexi bacterium]|nr:CHRD domain-containing protein [Chloroflexota bacterium]
MRITRTAIALLSLSTLLLASLAFAGATMAGGRPFTTELLGANERPNAGDPDGSGTATVTLNPGTGEVCYEITVSGVDPLTAAHIHEAPAGSPGGVVIALPLADDCTTADRDVILEILRNPSDYYVNVHNAPYPGGALRGQLSR